jgi:hypothetical protein
MCKLFIFGFNSQSPRGGMLDLLTVQKEEDYPPFAEASDVLISAEVLKAAVAPFPPCEHYQVVHFDGDCGALNVEHWNRTRFLHLPSQAELASGTIFEDTKGNYVRREAVQATCESNVGYVPA